MADAKRQVEAQGIRNRIRELTYVRAGDLRANPRNWRRHPAGQERAMRAALREIGWADAILVRRVSDSNENHRRSQGLSEPAGATPDRFEIIDGHLRAGLDAEEIVPVLVLDVDEAEADKLLCMIDPLAGMAQKDAAALAELLTRYRDESETLQAIHGDDGDPEAKLDRPMPEAFSVIVDCEGEEQQKNLYERMKGEGFKVRLLTL